MRYPQPVWEQSAQDSRLIRPHTHPPEDATEPEGVVKQDLEASTAGCYLGARDSYQTCLLQFTIKRGSVKNLKTTWLFLNAFAV